MLRGLRRASDSRLTLLDCFVACAPRNDGRGGRRGCVVVAVIASGAKQSSHACCAVCDAQATAASRFWIASSLALLAMTGVVVGGVAWWLPSLRAERSNPVTHVARFATRKRQPPHASGLLRRLRSSQ